MREDQPKLSLTLVTLLVGLVCADGCASDSNAVANTGTGGRVGVSLGGDSGVALNPTTRIVRCPSGADGDCRKDGTRPRCASAGEETRCIKWQGTGELVCSFGVSKDPVSTCLCYENEIALCNKSGAAIPGLPGTVGFMRCVVTSDTLSAWGACSSFPPATGGSAGASGTGGSVVSVTGGTTSATGMGGNAGTAGGS